MRVASKFIDVLLVDCFEDNLIFIGLLYDTEGEDVDLWHRTLGHVSMELLQNLSKKELVRDLPLTTHKQ